MLNLPLSSCNVTLICCDLQIPHCMAQRQNECASGKFGAFEERLVIPAEMNFVGERTEHCLRLFGLLLM